MRGCLFSNPRLNRAGFGISSVPLPPLADFLRHLAETPAPFRAVPEGFPEGRTRVRAVIADLVETLTAAPAAEDLLAAFAPADGGVAERNRLGWVLAAAHLLWHPAFRGAAARGSALRRFLVQEVAALAAILPVDALDREEERREELVRRAVRALGLAFPGEGENEAADRLQQVDSVERRRVMLAAAKRERAAREARARAVREAMAKKAAEEAAARYSRE